MVTLLAYVEFVLRFCMQYMGTATIGTAVAPTPMAPPLPLASAPQLHPEVMPPRVQPLATAAQDQLNLMAPPFRPRPRPPPLLLPGTLRSVLIEQDELHDLKWCVLLWLPQGMPACV
jgi:hypothetical protein